MHGISKGLSFGGLDVCVGAIGGHEPSLEAVKAALFEGSVCWFTIREGWFGEHELGRSPSKSSTEELRALPCSDA